MRCIRRPSATSNQVRARRAPIGLMLNPDRSGTRAKTGSLNQVYATTILKKGWRSHPSRGSWLGPLCTIRGRPPSALQRLGLISASLVIALGLWQVTRARVGDPILQLGLWLGPCCCCLMTYPGSELQDCHARACWVSSPVCCSSSASTSGGWSVRPATGCSICCLGAVAIEGVAWPGAILPADAGQLDRL